MHNTAYEYKHITCIIIKFITFLLTTSIIFHNLNITCQSIKVIIQDNDEMHILCKKK